MSFYRGPVALVKHIVLLIEVNLQIISLGLTADGLKSIQDSRVDLILFFYSWRKQGALLEIKKAVNHLRTAVCCMNKRESIKDVTPFIQRERRYNENL
jgi:hypothetical protein